MRGWGSIDEKISVRDKAKALGIFLLGQFYLYRLREKPTESLCHFGPLKPKGGVP